MKAIILAGGFATRLWPLTKEIAKPLIDVGGKPLISHIVEQISELGAIDGLIVATNARFAGDFERWKASLSPTKPFTIIIEETRHEGEKLGAIGGLCDALNKQNIDDDFLVVAGDNYADLRLDAMLSLFRKTGAPVVAAFDAGDLNITRRMGEVSVDGTRITRVREKPADPQTTLVSACCYVFSRETRHDIERYLHEGNNKDAPGHFISWLVQQSEVHAHVFDTFWFDVGDHDSLRAARAFAEQRFEKNLHQKPF